MLLFVLDLALDLADPIVERFLQLAQLLAFHALGNKLLQRLQIVNGRDELAHCSDREPLFDVRAEVEEGFLKGAVVASFLNCQRHGGQTDAILRLDLVGRERSLLFHERHHATVCGRIGIELRNRFFKIGTGFNAVRNLLEGFKGGEVETALGIQLQLDLVALIFKSRDVWAHDVIVKKLDQFHGRVDVERFFAHDLVNVAFFEYLRKRLLVGKLETLTGILRLELLRSRFKGFNITTKIDKIATAQGAEIGNLKTNGVFCFV